MKQYILVLLNFTIINTVVNSQDIYVPLDKSTYELVDRYEIMNGGFVDGLFTNYKPYKRSDVVTLIDSLQRDTTKYSKSDQFNFGYFYTDNWMFTEKSDSKSKKPLLKYFYQKKSDLYSVQSEHFNLRVNPVIYWKAGKEDNRADLLYTNTRGIQLEGNIDKKIGFYTFMADNQVALPRYVNESVIQNNVVPGQGFWKRFKDNGVDYFTARGYLTFYATKHIDVQFGHDQNFIGNGYRSIVLSDYATNYLFLKLNTKIWKFKYTNLFTEMMAETSFGGDRVLQKKFLALHHLSINLTKNFNVGIWEAVTFGRDGAYFELQYLNPIIFYRSVEQQVGSGDNALLGLDWRLNALKHFQFYGQITLDEFFLSHIRARDGWWANKQALQLGGKYINAFGISNLDLQGEYNFIRPYMYAHKNNFTNYSHYNQPLAHPMGANLKELIALLRYQPIPRLTLRARVILTDYGLDSDSTNWGGNILKDYSQREKEFGNEVGQGISTKLMKSDITLSFQLKHNIFIDATYTMRNQDAANNLYDRNTSIVSGALRMNIGQKEYDF